MIMKSNIHTVRLLNKNYEVKCPEAESSNLDMAAKKLNEQLLSIKRKFKHLNEFQTLLLAALHVSHELITCVNQQQEQQQHVTQLLRSLDGKHKKLAQINAKELEPQNI